MTEHDKTFLHSFDPKASHEKITRQFPFLDLRVERMCHMQWLILQFIPLKGRRQMSIVDIVLCRKHQQAS